MAIFRTHIPHTIVLAPKRYLQPTLTIHKLQPSDIPEIRRLLTAGYSHRKVAKYYGVHRSTIQRVASGENWSWIP